MFRPDGRGVEQTYLRHDRPRRSSPRTLRVAWDLGTGPITHLVRRLEARRIVVVTPPRDEDLSTVGAFSTSQLPRPVIVLTPNRTDDVYRHRVTTAHEVAHLVLHGDTTPGDIAQNARPTPSPRNSSPPEIRSHPSCPVARTCISCPRCEKNGECQCTPCSTAAANRACHRTPQQAAPTYACATSTTPGFGKPEPLANFPGEQPALLAKGFALACDHGLTITELATELAWDVAWVRQILGTEQRPILRLVPDTPSEPQNTQGNRQHCDADSTTPDTATHRLLQAADQRAVVGHAIPDIAIDAALARPVSGDYAGPNDEEHLGDQVGIATSLSRLGLLATARDRPSAAVDFYVRALLIRRRFMLPHTNSVLTLLAELRALMGGSAFDEAAGTVLNAKQTAELNELLDSGSAPEQG